jgi:hypothetical protein
MSADKVVHDDLYHPAPRRRETEPIAALAANVPTEPDPGTAEPETAPSEG